MEILVFINRLERLLQRGKFKEAENFAKIFSLDIELVYKARIKWLMSRLQLWNKIPLETLDVIFNDLFSLLKEIKVNNLIKVINKVLM